MIKFRDKDVDEKEAIWKGFLRLDYIKNEVQRKEYSLLTLFSSIGGIAKTLAFVCGSLTYAITKKLFMIDLLRDLFKVKRPLFKPKHMLKN